MDLNSPLFDRIRIKRACGQPAAEAGPSCEHPGCTRPGLYRAPMGRGAEGRYWRFCMDHVRAYNASYNYFDGMNDAAVAAYQKEAVIGHRPTWAMGVNKSAGRRKDGAVAPDFDTLDPLGVLRAEGMGANGMGAKRKAPEPVKPRHSGPVLRALDVLGLEEGADAAAIKAQYKTLVKRFHPDAHGGDRSFEARFRDIVKAHDTLRTAGLC